MDQMDSPALKATPRSDCLSQILALALWLWMLFVLTIRFSIEILGSGTNPDAALTGLAYLPMIEGLAILAPCLLLAIFWKDPLYRAVFQVWSLAAVYVLIMIPAHMIGAESIQLQATWHILLSLVFLGVILLVKRRISPEIGQNVRRPFKTIFDRWTFIAISISGLIALPWLAWGSLGSILDTILQLAAGLFFGVVCAIFIENIYLRRVFLNSNRGARSFLGGGWIISTTVIIMISGMSFNFGVMQVLLMVTFLPLAWVWMGFRILSARTRDKQPDKAFPTSLPDLVFPALLTGFAIAIPTMLIDPNELALITSMGKGEILQWALLAAGISFLIGLLIAGLFFILVLRQKPDQSLTSLDHPRILNQETQKNSWKFAVFAALLIWLFAFGIYRFAGQPGLYGEWMFVILKSQTDVSKAVDINDYTQRRQYVYQALVDNASASQADLRQVLNRWQLPYHPFYLVNALEVPANPFLRLWLENRPEVDRVVDSPHLRPLTRALPPSTGSAQTPTLPQWNLTLIGADKVWRVFNVHGEGVIIGQSDSGVEWTHPELFPSYRGKAGDHEYNWLDPWYHTSQPSDKGGHGTHTLGTALGQHTGVAPGATWIACANLPRNLGNPAVYLECMQFMLAPYPQAGDSFVDGRPDLGAMVINNSWGCPKLEGCDPGALSAASKALRAAGVFTVASAGNDGPNCSTIRDPLAIYPDVFTVGAIDSTGSLAYFSSLGPVTVNSSSESSSSDDRKPDMVAPGVEVLSAFPGNSYANLDGTSMAGPHVVGVVALMWSANPGLIGDIGRTEQILWESAQPYSGGLPDCPGAQDVPSTAVGYGIIDAYQAVKLALAAK